MNAYATFTLALAAIAGLPAAGDSIEEIVVTADFRDGALMRTAASISAFDEDDIEASAGRHLEALLDRAPNVSWATGASRARFLQIRGVGDLEQYAEPKYYPAVGVVVDGLELGDAANAAMLFDVRQIDILRGPQGATFGAGGHAGLVQVKTQPPSDAFEASVAGGAGSHGARTIGGVLSGPLGQVGARLAVQSHRSDGYIDNAYAGRDDTNGFDESTARLRLRWEPQDAPARYDLSVFFFDSDNGYDAWSLDNSRVTHADQPGQDAQRTLAASLRGEWEIADVGSLQASASTIDSDLGYGYDADWVSDSFCVAYACSSGNDTAAEFFGRDRQRATGELRFVTDAAVLGIYMNDGEERLDYRYPSLWYGDYASASVYRTSRAAAYGQYGWSADGLSFTVGGRVERFDDRYVDDGGFRSGHRANLWGVDATFAYDWSDRTLVYASLVRSDKPGGVNVAASSQRPWMSPRFREFTRKRLQFGKETLASVEAGVKTRTLDGRFFLRAALFATTRANAQLETWMWDDDAGLWIGYLDATSDAVGRGLEVEGHLDVGARLRLFAAIGLLDTAVDSIEAFDLDAWRFVAKTDRAQAKAPNYQFSLGAIARWGEDWSARASVEGRGASYYGYYHDGKLDGYALANLSVAWRREALQVRLWGRNLTNRDYPTHGLYFGADPRDDYGAWANRTYVQLGAPRTVGLDFELAF